MKGMKPIDQKWAKVDEWLEEHKWELFHVADKFQDFMEKRGWRRKFMTCPPEEDIKTLDDALQAFYEQSVN